MTEAASVVARHRAGSRSAPGSVKSDSVEPAPPSFQVHLESFDGPFDLLLTLISKHEMDVTAVALSKVTDDFLAHLRALGPDWEIGQVSEFLVVAATLLDLKAARLLPSGAVDDEEDLALLEARDLLVARLLQYRAVKQVAEQLAARFAEAGRSHPRAVALDPEFRAVLPELARFSPEKLAALATKALTPPPAPAEVSLDHLHSAVVSVPEQLAILTSRLRSAQVLTFRSLAADAEHPGVIVARFLALLELFRQGIVAFDQLEPLGELHVRWSGEGASDAGVSAGARPDSLSGEGASDEGASTGARPDELSGEESREEQAAPGAPAVDLSAAAVDERPEVIDLRDRSVVLARTEGES